MRLLFLIILFALSGCKDNRRNHCKENKLDNNRGRNASHHHDSKHD